jgi:hypothetical protein
MMGSMSKAAQGFSLRRTNKYVAGRNPRRTKLIGKRAIYGCKLNKFYGLKLFINKIYNYHKKNEIDRFFFMVNDACV